MNEESKKVMDALAGSAATGGTPGDGIDWKAKYEESQRELNSARVEQGRVRKLDEEKRELQRQLDEERAARQTQTVIDGLPEDVRGDIPEDYLKAQSIIAQRTADQAVNGQAERFAELERKIAEREKREREIAQSRFTERIEREFPGFLKAAVMDGGDKHAAWVQYQRYNAASINAAANACDFDTLAWHIQTFYRNELGIDPPSGGHAAAAADPSSIGGGTPTVVNPGKVYTWDEIDGLYDQIEEMRARGDRDGVRRLSDEVETAQREGRVK